MSLFNLSRRAEDVSFSTFKVQDPTTDLLLGKLLGLVSYLIMLIIQKRPNLRTYSFGLYRVKKYIVFGMVVSSITLKE